MNDDREKNSDGRVHPLRGADTAGFEHDLNAFVNYWQGMRRNGDVPLRSAIDPRGIETLLSQAFIAEKVTPGLARLRVAGTHLSDLLGMEVRGMPLSSLIDPAYRTKLSDALVNLFDEPAQIRLNLHSPGSIRRAAMTGALVILPLRSDLGDVSRALGCLVTSGSIGVAPRRFEITECRISSLDLKQTTLDEFADVQTPFAASRATSAPDNSKEQSPRHASERPYLRLVQTD